MASIRIFTAFYVKAKLRQVRRNLLRTVQLIWLQFYRGKSCMRNGNSVSAVIRQHNSEKNSRLRKEYAR